MTTSEILIMRLKEARVEYGLTQDGLADKAGVSVSMVSQIERGSRMPTLETLEALGAAVGRAPHELLTPPGNETGHRRHVEQLAQYLTDEEFTHEEVAVVRAAAAMVKKRRGVIKIEEKGND